MYQLVVKLTELKKLKNLETSFMSIFWGDILERFNACNKKLQSVQIDLGTVVEIYQSLITYIKDIRTDEVFIDYKARAIEKCGVSHFKTINQRKKKQKRFVDDDLSKEYIFNEFDNFKINTYFLILDQIKTELERRKIAYDNITNKNIFFFPFNGPYIVRSTKKSSISSKYVRK